MQFFASHPSLTACSFRSNLFFSWYCACLFASHPSLAARSFGSNRCFWCYCTCLVHLPQRGRKKRPTLFTAPKWKKNFSTTSGVWRGTQYFLCPLESFGKMSWQLAGSQNGKELQNGRCQGISMIPLMFRKRFFFFVFFIRKFVRNYFEFDIGQLPTWPCPFAEWKYHEVQKRRRA